MLKTVKKWMWDSGRPPPVFSKFPHFPVFFLATSLSGEDATLALQVVYACDG